MGTKRVERRLKMTGKRITELRADLAVANEACRQVETEADDARIKALVSETPIAEREHHEIRRHFETLERDRARLRSELFDLEARQDQLLDEYNSQR